MDPHGAASAPEVKTAAGGAGSPHPQPIPRFCPPSMPVSTATDVSGRTAPPADEPVEGETRGAKPTTFHDPSANPDWHPNPEDHPPRTSVRARMSDENE